MDAEQSEQKRGRHGKRAEINLSPPRMLASPQLYLATESLPLAGADLECCLLPGQASIDDPFETTRVMVMRARETHGRATAMFVFQSA